MPYFGFLRLAAIVSPKRRFLQEPHGVPQRKHIYGLPWPGIEVALLFINRLCSHLS
jgi:hypothetical protein